MRLSKRQLKRIIREVSDDLEPSHFPNEEKVEEMIAQCKANGNLDPELESRARFHVQHTGRIDGGLQQQYDKLAESAFRITKRRLKQIIREEYSRLKHRGLIKEAYDLESIRNTHAMSKSEAWMEGWDHAVDDLETDFEHDLYDPEGSTAPEEYTQGYDQGTDDYEEVNDIE